MQKFAFIIPNYNHPKAIAKTLENLEQYQFPCLIIDDGSNIETQEILKALSEKYDRVIYTAHGENQGKGAAVMTGFKLANELGITHAIQVDADGQHDLSNIQELIGISENSPKALVSGHPIYDDSVPMGRFIARYLTHFWVWVETLSFSIKDSMCGFRVYPIEACCKLMKNTYIGKRMDFDTEIMVKLYWSNVPVLMTPTNVIYPDDNTSNFRVFQDNWLITKMHTRLVFGMLLRSPLLIWRKLFG